jgi:hypothetical protein
MFRKGHFGRIASCWVGAGYMCGHKRVNYSEALVVRTKAPIQYRSRAVAWLDCGSLEHVAPFTTSREGNVQSYLWKNELVSHQIQTLVAAVSQV